MIRFNCPSCEKHYSFSDRFAGRSMVCTECKADIVVPEPEEELGLAPQDDAPPEKPAMPSLPPIMSSKEYARHKDAVPEKRAEKWEGDSEEYELAPPIPPASSVPPPPPPVPVSSVSPPSPDGAVPPVVPASGFPLPDFPSSSGFPPPDFPSSSGFPPPDFPSSVTSAVDSGILAYVYEEKHQDKQQEPAAAAIPVLPTAPKDEPTSSWKKNLIFWGGIGSMLALVLGVSLYLALYVDWRPPDTRPATLQELDQRKSRAIIEAKRLETESITLRLQAKEVWGKTCEAIDALTLTIGQRDDRRLDLADMDGILRRSGDNEALTRQLKPKREEIVEVVKQIEERLEKLHAQVADGVQKASRDEQAVDTATRDAELFWQESTFYERQATELRQKIDRLPKDRAPFYVEPFDKDRNRVVVDTAVRLDTDWTENYFHRFDFGRASAGATPDTASDKSTATTGDLFAAAFDGRRHMFGDKSLRITSMEKAPISIVFPESRDARARLDESGCLALSLSFPEYQDPLLLGTDPHTGMFGEVRVRFHNSAGYVEYRTNSPRYCEALFYDGRGKFVSLEIPLAGNTFWQRSDQFDMANFDRTDDSLDALLAGGGVAGKNGQDGEDTKTEGRATSFFSRIDWAEIQLMPLSDRTTFWIDGVAFSRKATLEPYDLLRAESLQRESRKRESDDRARRRAMPRLSAILSATQGGTPGTPPSPTSSGAEIGFIDPEEAEKETPPPALPSSPAAVDAPAPAVPDKLEFEGTDVQRTRKLMQWALQEGKGRIRAQIDGQTVSLGPKSRIPDAAGSIRFEEIDLSGYRQLSEDQLNQLGQRRELKRLNLSRTVMNDRNVIALATLTGLESLNLGGNELSFEALPALRTLKNLQDLNLDGIKSSVKGVDAFGSLKSLRSLSLSRSGFDSGDLNYLLPLAELESLDLSSTKVGDRALQTLRTFTELHSLNLSRTRITDAGLASLNALKQLRQLQLDGCSLTDECLDGLAKISSLETISALKTGITREGVRQKFGAAGLQKFKLSEAQ